jgi:hypothetical protein
VPSELLLERLERRDQRRVAFILDDAAARSGRERQERGID